MSSRSLTTVAIAAALSLTVAGCANNSSSDSKSSGGGVADSNIKQLPAQTSIDVPADAAKAAGNGKAKCDPNTTIAFVGAMTGDNAQLGINEYTAAQVAINEHNKANPNCQVKFKKYDTEGDPTKATGPATQVTGDKNVVAVLGLAFSGESKATGKIFESAGLAHITPSATNPDLTKENHWKTFFRGLANDSVQGPGAANLAEKLGAKKVFVVQDDSDYGIGLGNTSSAALKSKGLLAGNDKVVTKQKDFSGTATKIINSKADAVFYAGYYAEGAPLDQQLVGKGFKGVFIGPDGVKDDEFIKQAGDASKNAYFTCPCIPGDLVKSFAEQYKKVSGNKAPGTYSVEAYDATTIMLKGIDAGNTTRPKMLEYITNYSGTGLGKKYKWTGGELEDKAVYGYKVQDGKIVSVGKL